MLLNQWDSANNITCESVNRTCIFNNGNDVINFFSLNKVKTKKKCIYSRVKYFVDYFFNLFDFVDAFYNILGTFKIFKL